MLRQRVLRFLATKLTAGTTRVPGLTLGEGARVEAPRRLDGARYIEIGSASLIQPGAWLGAFDGYLGQRFKPKLSIGNGVHIGHSACIVCIDSVTIGDRCVLSEFVYVTDHGHGLDPEGGPIREQPLVSKGGVHIGADTFIGYQACILSGVTLGKRCVVGANSVVTHSFPDFTMLAGSPARAIKRYSTEQRSWIPV